MDTWITCGSLCAFFILGMWIAHRMDLDKKVKKWANTLPVPDLDGSRGALTDAQARPEEAERPALPPQIIVHLSLGDRLTQRAALGDTIEQGRKDWEAYKARQDAIRKAETGEL